MQSEAVPYVSANDAELLSKFIVTRTCFSPTGNNSSNSKNSAHDGSMKAAMKKAGTSDWRNIHSNASWEEWIEPLSVHARHPFSFHGEYGSVAAMPPGIPIEEYVALESADHVLIQSAASLYNNTIPNYGQQSGEVARHYFFDAGVSQFKTALQWFTCGYSQRKISFDQIYGWELRLQPPEQFWKEVPPLWKPYFHFLNVPVSAENMHPDSPVRFIKQLATEDDFVSFKLDIDHPATEIPIALMILSDPELTKLVDEFFFELHFDCEVSVFDVNSTL